MVSNLALQADLWYNKPISKYCFAPAVLGIPQGVSQGSGSLTMDTLPHSVFFCPVCEQEKDASERYRPTHAQLRFVLCISCASKGKYCPACEIYKFFTKFSKDSYRPHGASVYCTPCKRIYANEKRDPVKHRAHRLKIRFNMTPEKYDEMFLAQKGLCAICKKPETRMDNTGERVRALAVDHDHRTGAIRQLLCGSCNYLIGCAKDDADLLQAASEYLRDHNKLLHEWGDGGRLL